MTSTCALFWLDDFMRRPWSFMLARSGVVKSTPRPANWSAKSAEISPLSANRNGRDRGVKHLALVDVGRTEPPPEDLPGRVHQHPGLEPYGRR
jgi:hypothetical protein